MLLEVRTVQNFKLISGLRNLSIVGGPDNSQLCFLFIITHTGLWSRFPEACLGQGPRHPGNCFIQRREEC